jgi:hypothetical protein
MKDHPEENEVRDSGRKGGKEIWTVENWRMVDGSTGEEVGPT